MREVLGVTGAAQLGVAPVLEVPTVALLHALIAVADLASRVPGAIDGRAVWALVAVVARVAAASRARRLRSHARVPVPPRR